MPLGVVFVSGSNGKSTTTHMLVSVLRAHGIKVFTNPSGANLPQGIASAMLATVPLGGRLSEDIAVLEVDEAFGAQLARQLTPRSVLLINLQVDQLNRFYEPVRVLGMLESFAGAATEHLVINADDRNLVDLAAGLARAPANQTAFAVSQELLNINSAWLSRGDNPALALDSSDGNSARRDAAVIVTGYDSQSATLSVLGVRLKVALPSRGLHIAADAAAAIAMALAILGDRWLPSLAVQGFAATRAVFGRGEILNVGAEQIELLTMKNPPSLQLNLDYLDRKPEQLLIAVDEGTPDPSWIYGSDLTNIDHVDVLTGSKCWQLATRFAYAEIPVASVEPRLDVALAIFLALPKPKRGVKTMIVNYEQMMSIRKELGFLDLEG